MNLFEKALIVIVYVLLLGIVEYQGRVIASQRHLVVLSAYDSARLAKCQRELAQHCTGANPQTVPAPPGLLPNHPTVPMKPKADTLPQYPYDGSAEDSLAWRWSI
jgi:hypothetical protein